MKAHGSIEEHYGGLIESDEDGFVRWFGMLSLAKNNNDPSPFTGTRDETWPLEIGARVSFVIHRKRQFLTKVQRFHELPLPSVRELVQLTPDPSIFESNLSKIDFLSIHGLTVAAARSDATRIDNKIVSFSFSSSLSSLLKFTYIFRQTFH